MFQFHESVSKSILIPQNKNDYKRLTLKFLIERKKKNNEDVQSLKINLMPDLVNRQTMLKRIESCNLNPGKRTVITVIIEHFIKYQS